MISINYVTIFFTFFTGFLLLKLLGKKKNKPPPPSINVIPADDTKEIVKELRKIVKITTDEIKPKYEKPYRKYRYILNSAERKSGTAENYTLDLYEPIYSIEKIQLMRASFPTSLKLINDYNNLLIIDVPSPGPGQTLITLDKGYFNGDELASMLENKISALFPGFNVTYNSNSGYLEFSYTSNFSFPGTPTNIDYILEILGFPLTGSGAAALTAVGELPANTAFPQNILLQLSSENYDFNSLDILSTQGKECFAFLQIPSGAGGGGINPSAATVSGAAILVEGGGSTSGFGTYIITKDQTNAYYQAYEGTLPQLKRLNVKLKQLLPNGTLVDADFNNINHSIEIEITARVDKSSLQIKNGSLK